MSQLIATSKLKAVIGTGITGVSVARFLAKQKQSFVMFDTRINPPNLIALQQEFPAVPIVCGELDLNSLLACEEIILSPGIAQTTAELVAARQAGVSLVGDIELFARSARAPIVAITGSNAKSTVTTLVGEMALAAGIKVAVGGNLGVPALDLLADDVELYVLELSSFQLELVTKLNAKVATILNISADHLDRYDDMRAYVLAKLRIFFGAEKYVLNRKDVLAQPPLGAGVVPSYFGGKADFGGFGLIDCENKKFLAKNLTPLMPVTDLQIAGAHNIENALAALALGDAAGIPMSAMLQTLKTFKGLAHRCEYVATIAGVHFYNDSKGTNIGASVAAIKGFSGSSHKVIVILGGEGKGQNFADLYEAIKDLAVTAILLGRDAQTIAEALPGIHCEHATSLVNAVSLAVAQARAGDTVLLSPACASFDMFKNYEDRGAQFCAAVMELTA